MFSFLLKPRSARRNIDCKGRSHVGYVNSIPRILNECSTFTLDHEQLFLLQAYYYVVGQRAHRSVRAMVWCVCSIVHQSEFVCRKSASQMWTKVYVCILLDYVVLDGKCLPFVLG